MTDDRRNIKVSESVFDELDDARDLSWPAQLVHWKRIAERDTEWVTEHGVEGDIDAEPLYPDAGDIAEAVADELDEDVSQNGIDADDVARSVAREIDHAAIEAAAKRGAEAALEDAVR